MAMDWRASEPVALSVGPVLSLDDAVHSKVSALYGRGAARDYLDVDAIRASGRFTDAELIAAAQDRDPGFDVTLFERQLDQATRLRPDMVAEYGIDADQLEAIKQRFATWAATLRHRSAPRDHPARPAPSDGIVPRSTRADTGPAGYTGSAGSFGRSL